MTTYIGIDPGSSSGAFAFILTGGLKLVVTHSFKNNTEKEMCEHLKKWKEDSDCGGDEVKAVIEDVHTFPGQGISSSGKFMRNKGLIEGFLMALNIPYERVSPQRWVKSYGMKKDKGETQSQWKKRLRQRAQELFPKHKVVAENADALLIANYLINQKVSP